MILISWQMRAMRGVVDRAPMSAHMLTTAFVSEIYGSSLIPAFDPATGALPPGDHQAAMEQIAKLFGFMPRRPWLLKGLRAAVEAFWAGAITDIYIDGSSV